MSKRQRNKRTDRMELQNHDWSLKSKSDYVGFNGGSESVAHFRGKCLAAYALRELGYRVASECKHPLRGEVDVLGYGHESRDIICIEVETDLSRDVILDKVSRYCENTPISECFSFDPVDLPDDPHKAVAYIKSELAYES